MIQKLGQVAQCEHDSKIRTEYVFLIKKVRGDALWYNKRRKPEIYGSQLEPFISGTGNYFFLPEVLEKVQRLPLLRWCLERRAHSMKTE
jgi:hypothetical protein